MRDILYERRAAGSHSGEARAAAAERASEAHEKPLNRPEEKERERERVVNEAGAHVFRGMPEEGREVRMPCGREEALHTLVERTTRGRKKARAARRLDRRERKKCREEKR